MQGVRGCKEQGGQGDREGPKKIASKHSLG